MGRRKKTKAVRPLEEAHVFVKKELHHDSDETNDPTENEEKESLSEGEGTKKVKHKKEPKEYVDVALHGVTENRRHIDEQLAEIYGNDDGTLPDMKHFEKQKHHKLLTAFIVLLFSLGLLGTVAYMGFFVWQPSTQFAEEDVILSVSGNEKVLIGSEVQFRLRYKNAGSAPLAKATIQAHYPEGFVFESASLTPTGDGQDQWAIGSLNKDDGGYIDITGRMYGDMNSEHSVRVFMNYMPSNFTSEFQKVAHSVIRLTESPIELKVELPSDVYQGVQVPVKITAKKKEGVELLPGKYIIQVDPSGIFTQSKSDPKSDAFDARQWTLDSLDTEKTITLQGSFTVSENKKPEFLVSVLGQPASLKEKKFIFAEQMTPVAIAKTEVVVQSVVNGSAGQLKIQPGEKLITRVVVKNNGASPLKNVKIRLQLDAPAVNKQSIIDWAKVSDSLNGDIQKGEQINDTTRRGQIIWSSKHIPELASLPAGKEVAIDLEIPIKDASFTDLDAYKTFKAEMKSEIQYDAGGSVQTISGSPVEIILQSDLSFDSEFELSPSSATITWVLKNSFHELKDIQVKADFFGEVKPDENSVFSPPAGSVTYAEKSKSLVWKIDTLPTVADVLSYEFVMNIQKINPSQTQLTSKIQIEAIDIVTGEKIVKVVDAVPVP